MTASPLVPVVPGTIGNVHCLTVDGRALHGVLGVRRVFAAWIQGRINKYGFVQGHDFEVFSNSGKNAEGGRPSQEYRCSLDMGKELCMVENNENGRIARRYFIECERRLLAMEPTSPDAGLSPSLRAELKAIVDAKLSTYPASVQGKARAEIWTRFNRHFKIAEYAQLPAERMPEARDLLIEMRVRALASLPATQPAELPAAVDPQPAERPLIYRDGKFYPPRRNRKHVAGPREKAVFDFWRGEFGKLEQELDEKFRALLDGINRAAGTDLYAHAVSALGREADTMFSISCLLEGLYLAQDMARSSFKEALDLARLHMRVSAEMAVALNR